MEFGTIVLVSRGVEIDTARLVQITQNRTKAGVLECAITRILMLSLILLSMNRNEPGPVMNVM